MIPFAEVDVDHAIEEVEKIVKSNAKVRIHRHLFGQHLHHDGVLTAGANKHYVWCNGWHIDVTTITAVTKIRKSQSKLRFGPGFYKERQLIYEPTMKLSSVDEMVKKLLGAHG